MTAKAPNTQEVAPRTVASPDPASEERSGKRESFRGWSKTIVNFWLDAMLLMVFLVLTWISAVLQFVFPAGGAADSWILWNGTVEHWRGLQFAVLCLFALGIVLHVMLHWSWVCGVVSTRLLGRKAMRDDGSQTLIGVGVLVALLLVLTIGLVMARVGIHHEAR
jgi:hypothetical protein